MTRRAWLLGAAAVAVGIAAFVSPWASPWPDGLERVAEKLGVHTGNTAPVTAPLPDYTVPALGSGRASTAAAGVIGTLLVLALASGCGWLLTRSHHPTTPPPHHLTTSPPVPDARLLLLAAVIFVVIVATTPPGRWTRLGAEAALAAVGLAWARVPVGWALGRLTLLIPFVALALVSAPFVRPAGGISAAVFCGSAVAKALLSFCALAVLARRVEVPELLVALGRLRVPPVLVSLIGLMLRYLHVFEEEARRMLRARDARGTPPTLRRRAAVAGHMVGSLFLRSYERSERISQAMLARGFNGVLLRHAPMPLTPRDWSVGLGLAVALAAILLGT